MTAPRVLVAGITAALALTLSPAGAAPPVPSAGPSGAAPTGAPAAPDDDRGTWRVDDVGDGRFAVAWTSPTDLPVRSDRPTIAGDGLAFGPTTTGDDGRTVRAVVTAPDAPSPADLDVVLSGDRLDERGLDTADVGTDVMPELRADPLPGTDPGRTGPHAVVRSDYQLPAVRLPGMPEPIEMVGHVVEPAPDAATGPRPLVLFLHGRHSYCYDPDDPDAFPEEWPCAGRFEEIPSHLGYDYVQATLASQGYATVSVRVNGINAQDYRLADGGAGARAAIVRRHLGHWARIAAEHQVDPSRVVLVGHSRGGEGVDRASIQISPAAPYWVVGQVLLAPTDFASHTAPYVPTVTVLPYCDGDVYDLQGQKFTDVARDLDPADDSLKSSVLVMGANHNFFNTEWTPRISAAPSFDDWFGDPDAACGRRHPGRLSAVEQRRVGRGYIAGAVGLFAAAGASYLPLFDGTAVTPPSVGDADVRSHAIGGGRDEVRPGIDALPSLASDGADTQLCTGVATFEGGSYVPCGRLNRGEVTPHWITAGERTPTRRFLRMTWGRAGAVGGLELTRPLDLSASRLELRTIVDPRRGDVALRVRISDAAGGSAVLEPEGGTALPALLAAPGVTKLWAQPVLVDPAGVTGVDLTRVRRVEILGDSARGQVFVADVSAAPTTPPPTPSTRMPRVSVGDLRLTEGAGGRRTARVPFTIIGGPPARPARFVALTAGEARGSVQRLVVDVAAGQTSGFIPVEYVADRTDDPNTNTSVTIWPLRGLATDDYLGSLRVIDDDPTPRVTLTATRQVREGGTAVFRLQVSAPVGADAYAEGLVVRSPGVSVQGRDVGFRWLREHGSTDRLDRPLWRTGAYAFAELSAGERVAEVRIPIARNRAREPREQLTVTFRLLGQRRTATVTVLDVRR